MLAGLAGLTASADVVVETAAFKLVMGDDATAKSLIVKATGEEMLEPREGIPVFATTQIRPFNNEIRLVQQAKRTTYPANRVRREGDRLTVGLPSLEAENMKTWETELSKAELGRAFAAATIEK